MFTEITVPVTAFTSTPNLINSAARPDLPDHWELGFSWIQEACPDAVMDPACGEPTAEPGLPPGIASYLPHGYRVRDECSTLADRDTIDRMVSRLQRKLDAVESYMAARELWLGTMTQADPAPDGTENAFLASEDADQITVTGTVAERLGQLEAAALDVAHGTQVVLHVPPAFILPLGNLLRRVGTRLYTPLDSMVIADAGYPGTGPLVNDTPAPGAGWAYATGLVSYRSVNIDQTAAMSETLNRTTNRREVWAGRLFAATFDPCLHLAADLAAA